MRENHCRTLRHSKNAKRDDQGEYDVRAECPYRRMPVRRGSIPGVRIAFAKCYLSLPHVSTRVRSAVYGPTVHAVGGCEGDQGGIRAYTIPLRPRIGISALPAVRHYFLCVTPIHYVQLRSALWIIRIPLSRPCMFVWKVQWNGWTSETMRHAIPQNRKE